MIQAGRNYTEGVGHKRIGLAYGYLGYVGGLLGWVLSVLIRASLMSPGLGMVRKVKGVYLYNSWITAHGLVMLFLFVMPFGIGGFGNYMLPLLLGVSELSLPRMNGVSVWYLTVGVILLLVGQVCLGKPVCAGWTLYPPLLTRDVDGSGVSTDTSLFCVHLLGLSSGIGAVNMLSTIGVGRHAGLTWMGTSLYIWSLAVTSILLVLSLPVLAVAVTLAIMDRNVGTSFYDGSQGGDPVLYQHLFWFFGHPEVYIIILPIFGLVSTVCGQVQRREVFGKEGMVYCLCAIGVVGFAVWGHHMYTAGLDVDTRAYFSGATAIISIPTGVKVFSYIATLVGARGVKGSTRASVMSFLGCFTAGGFSGLMLSSGTLDEFLHDTYFVVGHFHTVLSLGAVFGILTGINASQSMWTGASKHEGENTYRTYQLLVGAVLVFLPMHAQGLSGGVRRVPEYADIYLPHQQMAAWGFWIIVVATLGTIRTWAANQTSTLHANLR